jgi:hypothetical protein
MNRKRRGIKMKKNEEKRRKKSEKALDDIRL